MAVLKISEPIYPRPPVNEAPWAYAQGIFQGSIIIRNLRFPIPSLQGNPRGRAAGNSLRD